MWQGLIKNSLNRLLGHVKSVHCQANVESTSQQMNFHPGNYFKKLHPWKSKDDFTSGVIKSIFFHHDGLIALNKPYGVAVYKHKDNVSKPRDRLSRSQIPETKYAVEDALPAIMKHFNLDCLEIMKSAERFTTGVCLLASRQSTAERIKAAIKRTATVQPPYQTYWAITRGSPTPPMACTSVGLKMVPIEEQGLEPEIIWKPSRRQTKTKAVKMVNVHHRVLSSNQDLDVALCEVATRTNKSHFVRVYCIHRSSCVLGDTLYSPRLRTVLGKTVVLSPRNYDKTRDHLPPLNNQVAKSLGIICAAGEEMAHIPVLLHLRSLNLCKWYKDRDLVLTAPIPDHFKWASEQLKLDTYPLAVVSE